jgi:hypothetical protein
MTWQRIKREDVPGIWQFQVSLTDHPVSRDEQGVLRYEKNPLTCWLEERINLNEMWQAYRRGRLRIRTGWTRDQFMQFYREIGYSLQGFEEVWIDELEEMEQEQGTREERVMSMTDRYHSLIVVLEKDIRDDDAEELIKAIKMLRGVLAVDPEVVDPTTHMAEARARIDIQQKLFDALREKGT